MKVNKEFYSEYVEFNSLLEFYNYIMNTPFNETFKDNSLGSVTGGYSFTQTHSFDEAVELFKHGWKDMSEKLTQRLKVEAGNMEKVMVSRSIIGVQGYQPVVPLYLNGIPNNMISRKMQLMPQKVITLNKSITYSSYVTIGRIVEQSIKALAIIKKLENQNYRCNFNIIFGSTIPDKSYVVKIRIKTANERLNVDKLSFPLVHPSMLRRLLFRFLEVYPNVPRGFRPTYGTPMAMGVLKKIYPKEILLPSFIDKDIKQIHSLKDLENF